MARKRWDKQWSQDTIGKFFASGSFPENTTFTEGEERTSLGYPKFWYYTCETCSKDLFAKEKLCNGVFQSTTAKLVLGTKSCRCGSSPVYTAEQWQYRLDLACEEQGYIFKGWESNKILSSGRVRYACPEHGLQTGTAASLLSGHGCKGCKGKNQLFCYIMEVYAGDLPISLKVGISKNPRIRCKQLGKHTPYEVRCLDVYKFPSVRSCQDAEKACLSWLVCGTLTSEEFPAGWTETTSLLNYDKIVEIYERFGGTKK